MFVVFFSRKLAPLNVKTESKDAVQRVVLHLDTNYLQKDTFLSDPRRQDQTFQFDPNISLLVCLQ